VSRSQSSVTPETDILERTKDKMVTRLKVADKNSRFPRFQELAPELREMVYLYAMDDKACTRPAPPPISRTNRLIRSESLPVFFKNVTMNVHLFSGSQWKPSHQEAVGIFKRNGTSMHISKDYLDYFNYATEKGWVRHMRRFQWYVGSRASAVPGGFKRDRTEKILVELSKDKKSGQITEYRKKPQGRLAPDDNRTSKFDMEDGKTVTDHKFKSMFQLFLGAYENLKKD
jgi:hypothetical protein